MTDLWAIEEKHFSNGVKIICGVLSENLLAAGTLKAPMLKALPATFSWPQLFTALIGGAVALLIVPVIRKALHK